MSVIRLKHRGLSFVEGLKTSEINVTNFKTGVSNYITYEFWQSLRKCLLASSLKFARVPNIMWYYSGCQWYYVFSRTVLNYNLHTMIEIKRMKRSGLPNYWNVNVLFVCLFLFLFLLDTLIHYRPTFLPTRWILFFFRFSLR